MQNNAKQQNYELNKEEQKKKKKTSTCRPYYCDVAEIR